MELIQKNDSVMTGGTQAGRARPNGRVPAAVVRARVAA
jgi:hypothetical protein